MSDPTPPRDAADRAWFRSHVDPVVGTGPVPDAWDSIASRVRGEATSDVPAPVALAPRRTRRWLAAAAVLVVLAGIVAVGASQRDGATTSLTADQVPPTGLYVPRSLPDGWRLRTAWVSAPTGSCRGSGRSWEGDGGDDPVPRLELTYLPCGAPDVGLTTAPGPSLGGGIDRSELVEVGDAPDARLLTWEDGGSWSLRSEGGLSEDDLVAAATAVVADPASTAAPLPGLLLSGNDLANGVPSGPTVSVSLYAPDGVLATYHLNAPGDGPQATPLTVDDPQPIGGQALPVALRSPRWDGVDPILPTSRAFRRGTAYTGAWPAADLEVPRVEPVPDTADATVTQEARGAYDRLLQELIGGLRPATPKEWRAFLATAEKPPSARLRDADELADLTGPGSQTAPPDRTTTSTSTTDPEEPASRTYVTSSPGTPVARSSTDERLTPIDALELRLEMDVLGDGDDGPVLHLGELAPAKLVVHNPSAAPVTLTECTLASVAWGLIPADDPDGALPTRTDQDCAAFPEETVAPGATVRLPVDWRQPAGFVAQRPDPTGAGRYLGPLPEGTYLATLDVAGEASDVRLQLEVQVPEPACPVGDAAVAPYLGISRSAAQARAEADGFRLALASVDGEPVAPPTGVRCDRINVDVWHGLVVNATIT